MSAPREPMFYVPINGEEPVDERGPCPRNREIFDAVRVRNTSYRDAAKKFELSPARIGQIVKKVQGWIERTGGGPPRTWAERDRLNEYLHRQRLEMLFGDAHVAWKKSDQTHTTQYHLDADNKLLKKIVTVRDTPGVRTYWEATLKCELARYAFEKSRPHPPAVEEMTAAEKIREIKMTAEEVARAMAKGEEPTEEVYPPLFPEEDPAAVEPVVHPPAAEETPPTVTDPQPPVSNDSLPPSKEVATPSAAAAAPEPPKRKPRVIWELQHLTPGPGPVPPGEKLEIAVPRFDDFGRLRLTKMPCPELLDTFWETDSTGHRRWKPPIIVNGPPDMPCYQGVIPTPPNWNNINWMRENRRKWLERERLKREQLEREAAEKQSAAAEQTPPPPTISPQQP